MAGGNPFPTVFNSDTPLVKNGLYNTEPYDIKNTYAESWNLSIERQVAKDWLVYERAGEEPLCALATTVAGALDYLARRSEATPA